MSGYIRDGNGESLINATVYDLTTGLGTTTNEYGFFSLTLAEGNHKLRISYIGFDDEIKDINLDRDRHIDINLKENAKLGEVVVTGDSELATAQHTDGQAFAFGKRHQHRILATQFARRGEDPAKDFGSVRRHGTGIGDVCAWRQR